MFPFFRKRVFLPKYPVPQNDGWIGAKGDRLGCVDTREEGHPAQATTIWPPSSPLQGRANHFGVDYLMSLCFFFSMTYKSAVVVFLLLSCLQWGAWGLLEASQLFQVSVSSSSLHQRMGRSTWTCLARSEVCIWCGPSARILAPPLLGRDRQRWGSEDAFAADHLF